MSGRRLFARYGVAETLFALYNDDCLTGLWFAPAIGDAPSSARKGDLYVVRVTAVAAGLNGAFVDLGGDGEGFLRLTGKAPAEGALALAQAQRPALPGKRMELDLRIDRALLIDDASDADRLAAAAGPGRVGGAPDPLRDWIRHVDGASLDAIVCDNADGALQLRQFCDGRGFSCAVEFDPAAVATLDLEAEIERALAAAIDLPGGASIHIDEVTAGTFIDIDGGDAAGARHGNDKINTAAAKALATALDRRGIGGNVAIDFLPPSSEKARKGLHQIAKSFGRCEGVARSGMTAVTRRRDRLSLLEWASEPFGADAMRAGRRVRIGWAAQRALASLERTLRRAASAKIRLRVAAEVAHYIAGRPQWTTRLNERYGARWAIDEAQDAKRSEHHVEEG